MYDPWGTQISTTTQPLPTNALELALYSNGWKGTGRLPIGEDFYTMGNREYSPQAGRFLQRDPVVNGSTNAYEYALGDPWNNSDPSGNMSIGKWVGLAVSVIASAVLSIATAGAYAAIAAATIGAAVKGAAAFAVGAAAGATSGFASSTVEQLIDPGDIDYQRAGLSALIGGAIGGVAGAAQYGAIYAKQAAVDAANQAAYLNQVQQFDTAQSYIRETLDSIQAAHPGQVLGRDVWVIDNMFDASHLVPHPGPNPGNGAIFASINLLYNAGVASIGGAAAWGTNLLVPTPTAGGVPTPVDATVSPSDGTVDVGSEGAVLLDEAFG
ncbi:unannotated protein [freshwater metagenome]|uniref:Unannotated protein n=1 Tax=freshwater metagenome TaxID=449393 RepID=A0A6J7USV7_9ZZZZ